MFNKKEEIFDNLCEKDVPISRAAWYIKVRELRLERGLYAISIRVRLKSVYNVLRQYRS